MKKEISIMNLTIALISTRRYVFAFFLTWVWFSGFCNIAWTKEDANTPLIISNDKYQVSFAGEKPLKDPPGRNNYIFEIFDKETGKVNQFVLDYPCKPIEETHLKMRILENNRLIIELKWKKNLAKKCWTVVML